MCRGLGLNHLLIPWRGAGCRHSRIRTRRRWDRDARQNRRLAGRVRVIRTDRRWARHDGVAWQFTRQVRMIRAPGWMCWNEWTTRPLAWSVRMIRRGRLESMDIGSNDQRHGQGECHTTALGVSDPRVDQANADGARTRPSRMARPYAAILTRAGGRSREFAGRESENNPPCEEVPAPTASSAESGICPLTVPVIQSPTESPNPGPSRTRDCP
jgi:hypothetical protein